MFIQGIASYRIRVQGGRTSSFAGVTPPLVVSSVVASPWQLSRQSLRRRSGVRSLVSAQQTASGTHTINSYTTKSAVQALGRYVLVRIDRKETQTASGIVLAESAQEKPSRGTVVSVGGGAWHPNAPVVIPMAVKAGDVVLFGKYGGTEVKLDDEDHVFVSMDDIMGVYEGGKVDEPQAFKPVFDRVFVQMEKKTEKRSASGIIVAPTASLDEDAKAGRVVAVGPGRFMVNGEYEPAASPGWRMGHVPQVQRLGCEVW
ncbi:10 kda heat shock protein [Cyanidiococcus yangmingshanensis]|uniref:20 kDa chaperonin, chloroplastic n=1 Tax=Cyanidiococcus yangmingshanensis TaxID=2690220 RepID=A0A7J7IGD5_9RHOD|nr:10 kda heat shock protein [Cyanidiococcus yangmingshanensis]